MAREDEELEEGESSTKQSSAKSAGKYKQALLLAGVAVLTALIAVPVTVFTVGGSKKSQELLQPDAAQQEGEQLMPEGADDEDMADEGYEPLGAIAPLETVLVNLAQGGYLRAQIQIEFEERHIPARFYNQAVPIRDGIIMLLTQRTASELRSINGKEALRNDIKELVNGLVRRLLVKRVYFTQFVVQEAASTEAVY